MAYTNVWRTTVPSTMVKTNQLDDHIRRLRLDIQERMTVSGIDWPADPILTTGTRYHHMPWAVFKSQEAAVTAGGWTITNGGLSYNAARTLQLNAPIILPRNATIVDLHLSCSTGANGTIPWSLVRVNANTPTETVISTGSIVANTAQGNQVLATSINHVIDNTPTNYYYYLIRITFSQTGATGGPVIQGARIKYTVPNIIFNIV